MKVITCNGYVVAGGHLWHSRHCPMHGAPQPVTTTVAQWSSWPVRS